MAYRIELNNFKKDRYDNLKFFREIGNPAKLFDLQLEFLFLEPLFRSYPKAKL